MAVLKRIADSPDFANLGVCLELVLLLSLLDDEPSVERFYYAQRPISMPFVMWSAVTLRTDS